MVGVLVDSVTISPVHVVDGHDKHAVAGQLSAENRHCVGLAVEAVRDDYWDEFARIDKIWRQILVDLTWNSQLMFWLQEQRVHCHP